MKISFLIILTILSFQTFAQSDVRKGKKDHGITKTMDQLEKTDKEWKKELSPEAYRVLREKGTERPFVNKYHNTKEQGIYECAACGNDLFSSDTKYDSHTGWPSFWAPLAKDKVKLILDKSQGMIREEVVCARCGSHLGHVFNDGPKPTGRRYCMNSVSLELVK
jgi:peptide-methionine (R)-S-oxide reductase